MPIRIHPYSCSRRGCVPKDGLCPSGSQGGYSLSKENVPPGPPKEKRGDATVPTPLLAQRGGLRPSPLETPPGQGSARYRLPCRPQTHLPAAPIGVPCGTALPHLGARNSLGCKEDAPCFLFRCRWRSFAERAALSNAGSARYRLPCRPQTHLPATPIGVPCRTALPHLEVRHSPGCKEDAPCSLFRCRWRSFAEWTALSNARSAERETEGVLSVPGGLLPDRHGVPGWTTAVPRPCHAGTDRFLSRTVENRIPQTCAPPQVWIQRFSFPPLRRRLFFWQDKRKVGAASSAERSPCGSRENRGAFQQATPVFPASKAHLLERSLDSAERASADRAGICAASREFCPGGAYRCSPDRVFPQGCFRASVRTPSRASGPSS